MGRVKETIPDYIYENMEELASYAFKQDLDEYLAKGEFQDNSLLREFL